MVSVRLSVYASRRVRGKAMRNPVDIFGCFHKLSLLPWRWINSSASSRAKHDSRGTTLAHFLENLVESIGVMGVDGDPEGPLIDISIAIVLSLACTLTSSLRARDGAVSALTVRKA